MVPYRCKTVRIHRMVAITFIPNPDNLPIVDHIDRNRSNNHVNNLRWVTRSQNQMNSTKTTSKTSSKYKGVSLCKRCGKWHAYIMLNRKRIHIGYYDNENTAAEMYNNKAMNYLVNLLI